jgi:hypothetical protein
MVTRRAFVAGLGASFSGHARSEVLHYLMRGEVRLLWFWVGRSGVGGGTIRVLAGSRLEEAEVLFGSEPDRVPGGVNRWGYGKETCSYREGRLVRTVFEGLMRHFPDRSIEEVKTEEAAQNSLHEYWFDAIRSEVTPGQARSEIHVLSAPAPASYRSPEALLARYRAAVAARPPDRRRQMDNHVGTYREPYGFLSALWDLIQQVVSDHPPRRAEATFVYHARPYRLTLCHAAQTATHATAEFETLNLVKGSRVPFTLVVPRGGPRRGLPEQITLQPRWWLRLRLDQVKERPD